MINYNYEMLCIFLHTEPNSLICVCVFALYLSQTPVFSKEKGKSKKNKVDGKQKNDKKKEASEGWVVFCDFHEITHAVIKEATVTIYRQDNKRMVRHTNKSKGSDSCGINIFHYTQIGVTLSVGLLCLSCFCLVV